MVKKGMPIIVKWLGHASFQVKIDETILYVDPYAGEYVDTADIILITHSHHDHYDPTQIAKISNANTVIVAPKSCASEISETFIPIQLNEKITKFPKGVIHSRIINRLKEAVNQNRIKPGKVICAISSP